MSISVSIPDGGRTWAPIFQNQWRFISPAVDLGARYVYAGITWTADTGLPEGVTPMYTRLRTSSDGVIWRMHMLSSVDAISVRYLRLEIAYQRGTEATYIGTPSAAVVIYNPPSQYFDPIIERITGGPQWLSRVISPNGINEKRVKLWDNERRMYSCDFSFVSAEDRDYWRERFIALRGRLSSFWFFPPDRHLSAKVSLGTGDGATKIFDVVNENGDEAIAGTAVMYLDNVVSAIPWYIDRTSNTVVFASAPDEGVAVSWTGFCAVSCRFDTDDMLLEHLDNGAAKWNGVPVKEVYDVPKVVV